MRGLRHYLLLIAIYVGVALPVAGVLLLYQITRDPYLKPLGLTREKLAEAGGEASAISIFVQIDWGTDRSDGATKAQLRDLITGSLTHRTDDVVFRFNDVPGDAIGVTYVVGPNRYGPYPTSRMIDGIPHALAAMEMTQRANR